MQLTAPAAMLATLALAATATPARADGEVAVRGAYFKERATRVEQPMIDARFDAGDDAELDTHVLVDAITSASVSSGAAANPFTEHRWEFGGGYSRQLGNLRLGGVARYSTESDYRSVFGGVNGQLELADKNTTVGLAINGGHDNIDNAGLQGGLAPRIEGTLQTVMASASFSQILTPDLLIGVTYDFARLSGFQQNPYRTVVAGGVAERERHPTLRKRHAFFANAKGYLPATRSTLIAGYRFYFDDWGIKAHTPEVRLMQLLPREVALALRYRYYWQSKADFYKAVYDTNDPAIEPYLSDDVKLSHFTGQTYGAQLDVPLSAIGFTGDRGDIRATALFEYVIQNNRFGNGVIAQMALTVPFRY